MKIFILNSHKAAAEFPMLYVMFRCFLMAAFTCLSADSCRLKSRDLTVVYPHGLIHNCPYVCTSMYATNVRRILYKYRARDNDSLSEKGFVPEYISSQSSGDEPLPVKISEKKKLVKRFVSVYIYIYIHYQFKNGEGGEH